MTAALPFEPTPALRGRAWWLLIAIHVPALAFTIAQGGLGLAFTGPSGYEMIAVPLSIAAGALQLRHSFAAAQGIRPRYWMWTLALLVVIATVPIIVLKDRWITLQWFVVASFAMLLPARIALAASVVCALGLGVWFAKVTQGVNPGLGVQTWAFFYWEALLFLGGVGLYGATRLVRLMDQLRDARADLAELAIGRERLRISRDLHDLLGQSV
jgi:two-component system sensor histidine kinase DesK